VLVLGDDWLELDLLGPAETRGEREVEAGSGGVQNPCGPADRGSVAGPGLAGAPGRESVGENEVGAREEIT
jgi:hypothetical protein